MLLDVALALKTELVIQLVKLVKVKVKFNTFLVVAFLEVLVIELVKSVTVLVERLLKSVLTALQGVIT